jgi:hypothetical protein
MVAPPRLHKTRCQMGQSDEGGSKGEAATERLLFESEVENGQQQPLEMIALHKDGLR